MTARFALARWGTLVFAYVFTAAAVAALALFPFEAAAAPLVPGILIAVEMGRCAGRMSRRARAGSRVHLARSREELWELARANLGLFAFALPLAVYEALFDWPRESLVLATCALSALAVLHGGLTLAVFHFPSPRVPLPARHHFHEC